MSKKDELRHECSLIWLKEDYTEMVARGRIDIDLAKQFQSEDEFMCWAGLGWAGQNVYHLFED